MYPTDLLANVVADLRPGWYLRAGISKVPAGYYCLEYGFPTTTGARNVVAAVHPDDLDGIRDLYPEAFKRNENAGRCPVCGGLNLGDVTHTRC
jgi:hypothetical protein